MKTEPKNKNKLKKLEQEQNHRNGDHMEGYLQGGVGNGVKVQGISTINGRYKIYRGWLRIVSEILFFGE